MTEKILIGERWIGDGCPTYIIAEIGSNHDGSLEKAKELVEASRDAGADAVKFQSFTAEGLLNPLRPADDGSWEPNPAYGVLESLSLPAQWHYELKRFCDAVGIDFLSAPFDDGRADLLNSIGVPAFKIASGDITNTPLLRRVASFGKPVIISTGASYLKEVDEAVKTVMEEGNRNIALLHCVSLYPAAFEEVNIRSMVTMKKACGLPVGFSDHTLGALLPVAAVAMGASIIEKHITLSRSLDGPDHHYAMEVDEFKAMVTDIRNLEKAMGNGLKRPAEREMGERIGARRSIYLREDVKRGTVLTASMLKVVRHCHGMEPSELDNVIGTVAQKDLRKDMPLRADDICKASEWNGLGEEELTYAGG